ncbi:MAG: GNAT family N-acetyltransferase [Pikeienuella sp.]
MQTFVRGRYEARLAAGPSDMAAAHALRARVFRGDDAKADADHIDPCCEHMVVRDREADVVVCCFRLMPLKTGAEIDRTYSAQYYDLETLRDYPHPMVEMGRFCVHPDHSDPEILRVAWGAMTAYVDEFGVQMLFGCSSFPGTEGEAHMEAFALLKARHLAPLRWLPKVKAPRVFPFAKKLGVTTPDVKQAVSRMPPLLRTYLAMGGWVSDHAVVDNDLGTLHVFTGVEINRIPPSRARMLRAG